MKKFLLVLLAFISISCPSFASDWVYFGKWGGKIVYMDKDSVTKSYGEATGWMKFVGPDGKQVLFKVAVRERDRSFSKILCISYDAAGNIIQQRKFPYKYVPIVPDSYGEDIYNFLMENAKSSD